MVLNKDLFKRCVPGISQKNLDKYASHIESILPLYGIDTPLRIAHFLAQVGHESLNFHYSQEIASGKAYEGRKDLGNTVAGDGVKFKGRGIIQITGRANYTALSTALFNDLRLLDYPELLEQPENSVKAACWFWETRGLNFFADKDDLNKITRRINGGTNGLFDRSKRLDIAKKALKI